MLMLALWLVLSTHLVSQLPATPCGLLTVIQSLLTAKLGKAILVTVDVVDPIGS